MANERERAEKFIRERNMRRYGVDNTQASLSMTELADFAAEELTAFVRDVEARVKEPNGEIRGGGANVIEVMQEMLREMEQEAKDDGE